YERARRRAIRQTVFTARALMLNDFVHVVDVLQFWMDGGLRTDFSAEAAGDAESFVNSHFHVELISSSAAQRPAWLRQPGSEEEIEDLLNGLLIFRRERIGVDLIRPFP